MVPLSDQEDEIYEKTKLFLHIPEDFKYNEDQLHKLIKDFCDEIQYTSLRTSVAGKRYAVCKFATHQGCQRAMKDINMNKMCGIQAYFHKKIQRGGTMHKAYDNRNSSNDHYWNGSSNNIEKDRSESHSFTSQSNISKEDLIDNKNKYNNSPKDTIQKHSKRNMVPHPLTSQIETSEEDFIDNKNEYSNISPMDFVQNHYRNMTDFTKNKNDDSKSVSCHDVHKNHEKQNGVKNYREKKNTNIKKHNHFNKANCDHKPKRKFVSGSSSSQCKNSREENMVDDYEINDKVSRNARDDHSSKGHDDVKPEWGIEPQPSTSQIETSKEDVTKDKNDSVISINSIDVDVKESKMDQIREVLMMILAIENARNTCKCYVDSYFSSKLFDDFNPSNLNIIFKNKNCPHCNNKRNMVIVPDHCVISQECFKESVEGRSYEVIPSRTSIDNCVVGDIILIKKCWQKDRYLLCKTLNQEKRLFEELQNDFPNYCERRDDSNRIDEKSILAVKSKRDNKWYRAVKCTHGNYATIDCGIILHAHELWAIRCCPNDFIDYPMFCYVLTVDANLSFEMDQQYNLEMKMKESNVVVYEKDQKIWYNSMSVWNPTKDCCDDNCKRNIEIPKVHVIDHQAAELKIVQELFNGKLIQKEVFVVEFYNNKNIFVCISKLKVYYDQIHRISNKFERAELKKTVQLRDWVLWQDIFTKKSYRGIIINPCLSKDYCRLVCMDTGKIIKSRINLLKKADKNITEEPILIDLFFLEEGIPALSKNMKRLILDTIDEKVFVCKNHNGTTTLMSKDENSSLIDEIHNLISMKQENMNQHE